MLIVFPRSCLSVWVSAIPEHVSLTSAHTVSSTGGCHLSLRTPNSACQIPALFKVVLQCHLHTSVFRPVARKRSSPLEYEQNFLSSSPSICHIFPYISGIQVHVSSLLKDCKLWVCVCRSTLGRCDVCSTEPGTQTSSKEVLDVVHEASPLLHLVFISFQLSPQ